MPVVEPPSRPVVWIIHRPVHSTRIKNLDYSAASRFGEIRHILDGAEPVSDDWEGAYKKIVDWADNNFNPTVDYVLWVRGDPSAILLLGCALPILEFEEVNWLTYVRDPNDPLGYRYVPKKFNLKLNALEGLDA